MTTLAATPTAPPFGGRFDPSLFRISVDLYHRMKKAGVLTRDDWVELLDGLLVGKCPEEAPPRSIPMNPLPSHLADWNLFRLSVEQYERMGELGLLGPEDRVELLGGVIVKKPMKNPPHSVLNDAIRDTLAAALPADWAVRVQNPVRLDDGEPEPDLAVVRGRLRDYLRRHPTPADIAIVVEVSESSLATDRGWKREMYARNGIPVYWIVNLVDNVLEIYADPSGPAETPGYATARTLTAADTVDVVIAGTAVGTVRVGDLLP